MGLYQMSDEQNPTPDPDVTPEAPAQETDWKRHARTWEERAKTANSELEELRKRASKLDEIEEAQKTAEQKQAEELEKLRARAAELETELSKKDRAILVERVAASKGVPARYLHGDSEDDLNASADQFLEDAKTLAGANKPSGIVPSSGTGDPKAPLSTVADAQARAAAKYAPGK